MRVEWSGDDWQAYCELLFQERHAPAGYQRVPDTHGGDLGLEGYTVDGCGCGYQCFATEKIDVKARYEAQRDKMTAELTKMVRKKEELARLLGDHPLERWIFVVPVFDSKELVAHARKKELELREEGLPFLSSEFAIVIQTEDDFEVEKVRVEDRGAARIGVVTEVVTPEALEELEREKPEQVQTMDRKLAKIAPDPESLRAKMLRFAADGGNIQEHLRRNHPQTGEQVARELAIERKNVSVEKDLGGLHQGSVIDVRERLETRLKEEVGVLGAEQSSRLAHATIARWLMECPLDFPEDQ
jgi:hypothetical protein